VPDRNFNPNLTLRMLKEVGADRSIKKNNKGADLFSPQTGGDSGKSAPETQKTTFALKKMRLEKKKGKRKGIAPNKKKF